MVLGGFRRTHSKNTVLHSCAEIWCNSDKNKKFPRQNVLLDTLKQWGLCSQPPQKGYAKVKLFWLNPPKKSNRLHNSRVPYGNKLSM